MQPKTKTNDPIQPLRDISTAQGTESFLSQQPTEGKGTKPQPETEPPKRTINPEEEQQKWSGRFETAKTYQLPLFDKWAKWYDDMYAHVTDQTLAPWRSKVYMPIISSKVWDLISRFIQYRPGWEVDIHTLPVNTLSKEAFDLYMDEMNKKVEKVKMKLNYDYDNPLMEDSIPDELLGAMLDACVTGQGLGRAPFLTKATDYKSYVKGHTGPDYSKVKTDTAYQSGGENPYMKLIVNDDEQLLNRLQRMGKESIIKEQQPTPEWLKAVGVMDSPVRDHFVSMNPDLFRSRFAAFDPFRRSAAVAATMGAAAPDLLAAQQDEEMRKLQQLGLLGMVAP